MSRQQSLEEIEHVARQMLCDLWILATSLDVILAECREAQSGDGQRDQAVTRLLVQRKGGE